VPLLALNISERLWIVFLVAPVQDCLGAPHRAAKVAVLLGFVPADSVGLALLVVLDTP
jgi:hypothetical protein